MQINLYFYIFTLHGSSVKHFQVRLPSSRSRSQKSSLSQSQALRSRLLPDNRPQVKMDVNFENGMGISVGRLREDTVYDWKFVGLSHNTVRGAAGGAVLCAETLKAKGYIQAK